MRRTAKFSTFQLINNIIMVMLAVICILPFLHVLSVSLSSSAAVSANKVTFWPIGLNLNSYSRALEDTQLLRSLWISVERTLLSVTLGLTVTSMAAYVLSKGGGQKGIAGYKWFVGFFIVAMLFNGGMIPTYLVVTKMGLYNTIWALILPTMINVFNIILIMNFFKALPQELEEAAFIDGAGHWKVYLRVMLPLSLPVMATVGLFTVVGEWNEWLAGQIYMKPENAPLSTFLKAAISMPNIDIKNAEAAAKFNALSLNSAQIFIGALPILLIYPFLQKFFAKGIVIGAVKE
ncbi:carbohydrate ABC transporter permease [Paenibacillus sonchi]|uniref:Carbohydrate ABC transporter permease n=1 Tax=Paenibacillus sonchi TaxID=373687 RepID=A0A974PC80_9BACL|nr:MULTISPECIES: carbohydrate ABC transporter permease [Paenibacillus]QLG40503.1 carbohydrate ABC transporter permease [Paenibacillus sp. E222]QLG40513.1 carbohydrate ABC transporter permease [Paenibacillus sp. E222]QQZ61205.1 carbohydrate ABC transporter permease [Paenibacillus sonchi]